MKKSLKPLFFSLILVCFMAFAQIGLAQAPQPPPPPGQKGSSSNNGPAGAPIEDGIGVLLALGIAYGCYKIYEIRKKKVALKEEEPV